MLGRGDDRSGVWLDAEMCDLGRAVGWFNVDFQMPALDLNSGWQGLCTYGGQRTALCLEDLTTFVHLKRPVFFMPLNRRLLNLLHWAWMPEVDGWLMEVRK